jgi:hypothetical protein
VSSTWLSIRVDLVEGRGEDLWPRPGRIFAAARSHTFEQLAGAVDDAFARWDRAHLHQFDFGDSWLHLCTVAARRIDPAQQLGIVPEPSVALLGLGNRARPVRPSLER